MTANGSPHREESPAPFASTLTLGSVPDDLEEPAAVPDATEADGAMISFQETMRAFLQTQQEVLNAYFVQPAWDTGETVACAGSLADYFSRSHVIGESVLGRSIDPVERRDFGRPDDELPGWAVPDDEVDESHPAFVDPAGTAEPLRSGPSPGPWVGEVRRLIRGSEIETVFLLDRSDDPIAEHHTLGGRKVSAFDRGLRGLPVMPFAVMAEMTAQVAALVVSPGLGTDHARASSSP